jgi:hypothetical protein
MSKSSRKSELSPSVTGSNIDLGKNDVVEMGGKLNPASRQVDLESPPKLPILVGFL